MSCYPYGAGFYHFPTGPTGPSPASDTIEQSLEHDPRCLRTPTGSTLVVYPYPATAPTGGTGVVFNQNVAGVFADTGGPLAVANVIDFASTMYDEPLPGHCRLCQVDCVSLKIAPTATFGGQQIPLLGSSRLEVSLDPDFAAGYFVESVQTATTATIAPSTHYKTRTGRDEFHNDLWIEWGVHGYTDFIVFTGETEETTMASGKEDFFTDPLPSWNDTGLAGYYDAASADTLGPFTGVTEFSYSFCKIIFGSFSDSTDQVLEEFENNAKTVDSLWLGVADSKALARAGKTWFASHALSDIDSMEWAMRRRFYRVVQRGPTGAEVTEIHVPGRKGTKTGVNYWLCDDSTISPTSPIAIGENSFHYDYITHGARWLNPRCVDAAGRHTTESMKMPTGVTGPAELFWGDLFVNSATGMEANSYLALRIPGVAPFDQPAQPAALSIGCQAVGKDLKISFTHISNGEHSAGDRLPRAKVFSAGGVIGAGDVTPHDWGMEGTLPTRDAPSLTRGMTLEQYADAMNAYREYLYTEHADNYPLCAEYEWHRVRFVGPNEPWQKYGTNGSTVEMTCPSVANSNTYLGMSGAESSQSVTIDNSAPLIDAVNQFFDGHQGYIPLGLYGNAWVTQDDWTPPVMDPNNPEAILIHGIRHLVVFRVSDSQFAYPHPLTASGDEVVASGTIRQDFTVAGLGYQTYEESDFNVQFDTEPVRWDASPGTTTSTTTRRIDRQALWGAVLPQCGHAMFESCQYTAQLHEVMATVRRDTLNVDPGSWHPSQPNNALTYEQAIADPSVPMHYLLNEFLEQTYRTPIGGKINLSHRKTWKIEAAVKTAKVGLDGELSGDLLDHGTLLWPGGEASTKNFTLYDELKWTHTVTFTEEQWQSLEAGEAVTKTVNTSGTMDYGDPYFLPNYSSQIQFTFQFV